MLPEIIRTLADTRERFWFRSPCLGPGKHVARITRLFDGGFDFEFGGADLDLSPATLLNDVPMIIERCAYLNKTDGGK